MNKGKMVLKFKELEKTDGFFIHPIGKFFCGRFSRNKKNQIKMELSFQAEELVKDSCKGIPLKYSDFKLVPFILFVDWAKMQKEIKKKLGKKK